MVKECMVGGGVGGKEEYGGWWGRWWRSVWTVVVQVLGALVLAAHKPALPAAVTAPVSSKVSSTNAVSVQAVTVPSVSTTSLCEDRKPPASPRKLLSSVSESDGG